MLKFSPANTKLQKLSKVKGLQGYLTNNRKIYSFDILSGHKKTCPFAKECNSKVIEQQDGSLKLVDGPHNKFRCYSASQEVLFKNVYKRRKENTHILYLAGQDYKIAANELEKVLPKNAGIIRINSAGDMGTKNYLRAWIELAKRRPDILFYCYTKSIPFIIALKHEIDKLPNFVYTCSLGGYKDSLIGQHKLRSVKVVKSVYEARKLKLPIDMNDSFAADPTKRNIDFALLIHGVQKGENAKAVKRLKGKGSYGRK